MSLQSIIGVIVLISGFAVCAGWMLNIVVLKSVFPTFVTMKFSTAVAFIFTGISILASKKHSHITFSVSLGLMLYCLWVIYISEYGVLPYGDYDTKRMTVKVGLPSIGTLVCFLSVGLFSLFHIACKKVCSCYFSGIVIGLSVVALIGYAINEPILYYYVPNYSTGMALHTSILFLLTGIALYKSGECSK